MFETGELMELLNSHGIEVDPAAWTVMEIRDSASIHGYHAHINFDPETRNIAVAMREELGNRFDVVLGRVWDEPVGPHVKSMFQIAFEPAEFAKVVPWLMVNYHGLSIFIHSRNRQRGSKITATTRSG